MWTPKLSRFFFFIPVLFEIKLFFCSQKKNFFCVPPEHPISIRTHQKFSRKSEITTTGWLKQKKKDESRKKRGKIFEKNVPNERV